MLLRAKDKEKINQIAAESFSTSVEIWAYGSRVNGDAHDASDLDLVVKPLDRLIWEDFVMFKEELRQSNLPILVDVLVWDKVPKVFQKGILKNYEVLFESSIV